ncbi:MAG: tripartite tricarboxylate transporter permease [Deltaproteobacteria bacterium]|nr:tripartite tricarboxylate transporter permease [Deltaproteobacteria bacterium]
MLAGIIGGWNAVLDINLLFTLLFSVPLGIVVGVLPGVGAMVGITVLLPLTFTMGPVVGISMLIAVYCGSFYGGSVSAILINTPGSPAAICTIMDGYPMARNGEAHRAMNAAVVASFLGGVISVILLTLCAPLIAAVALKFSYTEYFAIAIFGIIMVVTTSEKGSFAKGIAMGTLGLIISTVGQDKMGTAERFTFGILDLSRGLPLLPVLVGLFAISQALALTEKGTKPVHLQNMEKRTGLLASFKDVLGYKLTLLKSSLIGTAVGAIPGTGSSISTFVSYSEAKRASKTPEKFGTGYVEGIIASESSNNSVTGGALIPVLALGIPGDAITAIMLGAFLVHGLIPGPMLFIESLDFVNAIFATMMVTYVLVLFVGFYGAKIFASVLKIREAILVPVILVLSFLGAYSINSSLFDVGISCVFGVVGYILNKYNFPLAPIVMGLILGPIAEEGLRRSLMVSKGSWSILVTQPISASFLALSALIVFRKAYVLLFSKKQKPAAC